MTWLDYAVFGVIAVSAAWGVWRGFVREAISLAGWVIAFLAANLFAGPLGERLPESLARPELRMVAAFIGIFVLTLLATGLAGMLLSRLLKVAGLGGLDRGLGGLFGIARGLVIVLAFALLAGLTSLPRDPAWTQSFSGPHLARISLYLKPWLPPALSGRLRYH